MATRIIPAQYHLPEADRLAIIRASSLNPEARIPRRWLEEVERQRQAFIQLHGHDGLNPAF